MTSRSSTLVLNGQAEVGSMVAYPVRRGSDMWMELGTVVDMADNGIPEDDGWCPQKLQIKVENGRNVWVTALHRVVLVSSL